jgi:BirA family biotin operon repressor/biotin-[acetyl-CoA-carboxylase] ligase
MQIGYSIVGVGVNVNQTEWKSDAPNPISMAQAMGKTFDIEGLLEEWLVSIKLWEKRPTEEIKAAYMQHLYRREGWHMYLEREVSTVPTAIAKTGVEGAFLAEVVNVTEQGELLLRLQNNEEKKYHFKQIRFVI